MSKPFQVTFTKPDRPEYEITEIYQAEDATQALEQAKNDNPDATIILVQQLYLFRK